MRKNKIEKLSLNRPKTYFESTNIFSESRRHSWMYLMNFLSTLVDLENKSKFRAQICSILHSKTLWNTRKMAHFLSRNMRIYRSWVEISKIPFGSETTFQSTTKNIWSSWDQSHNFGKNRKKHKKLAFLQQIQPFWGGVWKLSVFFDFLIRNTI